MYESVIYGDCPNCMQKAEAEGVHNGIGYVYPPLYCTNCGWSEHCGLWGTENCDKLCTEYEKCFGDKK